MIKKIIISILAILVLVSVQAMAANTITETGNVITITAIDSDWLWTANFAEFIDKGVPIISIQFNPGAADDKCVILNGTATSSKIFDVTSEDVFDQRIKYFYGNPLKLFLDFSAGVYSAGSTVIITVGRINTLR